MTFRGAAPSSDEGSQQSPATRPQSLMFSFLGVYVLGRDVAVYSGSVIEVFARLDVTEEAVRSTLTRMAKRGLLARHRSGRKTYFGLTAHAAAVLEDGRRRIWETGAVNRDWDGAWTLVGFSLPDSRRNTRHDLRSHLIWAGFGLLQSGMWIAPGVKDVGAIVAELGLRDHVTVLTARAAGPTETADLVRKAFDTGQIATRYHAFLDRWDVPGPPPSDRRDPAEPLPGDRRDTPGPQAALPDDLARQLLLHTDWLQLVRQDPHLPAEHLPPDWPAIRAEQVFHTLARAYERPARDLADGLLDVVRLPVKIASGA